MVREEIRDDRFDGATYLQLGSELDQSGRVTLEFVNIDMMTDPVVGARIKHFRKVARMEQAPIGGNCWNSSSRS